MKWKLILELLFYRLFLYLLYCRRYDLLTRDKGKCRAKNIHPNVLLTNYILSYCTERRNFWDFSSSLVMQTNRRSAAVRPRNLCWTTNLLPTFIVPINTWVIEIFAMNLTVTKVKFLLKEREPVEKKNNYSLGSDPKWSYNELKQRP